MRFMEIPQRLTHLLHQPDPLVLTHTIRYNGGEKSSCCYDIEVEMDDPVKQQMSTFLSNHQNMPEVAMLDQRVKNKQIMHNVCFRFTTLSSKSMK